MPGDVFSSTALTDAAIDVGAARIGSDEVGLVDDDVTIDVGDLTLRPGTRRRVSFRATPGTSLEVVVRAQEWFALELLDASRTPPPAGTGSPPAPTPPRLDDATLGRVSDAARRARIEARRDRPGADVRPRGFAAATLGLPASRMDGVDLTLGAVVGPPIDAPPEAAGHVTDTQVAAGGEATADPTIVAGAVVAARRSPFQRGRLGSGSLDGSLVIDGDLVDRPERPEPPPPLPVEVEVRTRGGVVLRQTTSLLPRPGSLAPARLTVDGIGVHEVVDVVFSNPNDVAVRCPTCLVRVERRVRTTIATLDTRMVLRAFDGAVRGLHPTIAIGGGEIVVSFDSEAMHETGIGALRVPLPDALSSLEGGMTFTADPTRIVPLSSVIDPIIDSFVRELRLTSAPDDLDTLVRDAFFRDRPDVRGAVLGAIDVEGPSARLVEERVDRALRRRPILANRDPHRPVDVAIRAGFRLTEITGSLGPVAVEMDRVEARSVLTFFRLRASRPAPFGDLPLDRLRVGALRPVMQVSFSFGDLDVDLDVPWWLRVGIPAVNLGAFLVEQGLEGLGEYLADRAERELPAAVHDMFSSQSGRIGQLAADTLRQIAARDHEFHSVAAAGRRLAIATIDPRQLRVPHRPPRRPSSVEGIDETLPPLGPIDARQAESVTAGSSPSEKLGRIDHLVFIMMENRSFDHMLGYLSHPDHGARGDIDGLDGSPRRLGGDLAGTVAVPRPGASIEFRPNLPHGHESIARQINGGAMDGFVSEYARTLLRTDEINPLGVFNDPERALRFQLPHVVSTYDDLARHYLVCDRWFSSVPAGTYPNRSCYYAGVTPALSNGEIETEFGYLPGPTVFDVLDHVGVDWIVYESDVSFARVFDSMRLEQQRIRPIAEMGDSLPAVTFIDPNFTGMPAAGRNNDDQPPTDVRRGQAFVGQMINRIRRMAHWHRTLILVTYDEHGGFADHVPPPGAPGSSHPPTDDGPSIPLAHPDAPTYGVRVPAFVVSPHVAAGSVSHHVFDHATVFRTVLERFAPQHVNSRILPERVRRARHLGHVLTDRPRRALAEVSVPSTPSTARPSETVGRVTVREPLDREDMHAVLAGLGRPRRGGVRLASSAG